MKIKKTLTVTLFVTLCVSVAAFAAACAKNSYTVTFDVLGHGVAPQSLTEVAEGSKIEKPEDPEEEGYIFNGWYKSEEPVEKWDFEKDTVNSDLTLYASWTIKEYTVTFNMLGHGTAPDEVNAEHGALLTRPATDPTAEDYAFNGWYKDEECKNLWNFYADKVTSDTVIYAGWKQVYPVEYNAPFDKKVENSEFFEVLHTGRYTLSLKPEDGTEGATLNYLLDGINSSAILNENGSSQTDLYFEAGTHKLSAINKAFDAKVTLQALAMPFEKEESYIGYGYSLKVAEAGDVPVVRFGAVNAENVARAVDFDGECYTLEVREDVGGSYGYEFVKIKINKTDGEVGSINVFTRTGGEWSSAAADTLEKARYAKDYVNNIHYSANGEVNTESVVNTFKYVYFSVYVIKNEWLEFSGFAEGTKFFWVNIDTGREGQIEDELNMVAGKPIKLVDDFKYGYLNHIAVKPAEGETSVTFTVKSVPEPVEPGASADKPVELEVGTTFKNDWKREVPCYFTFNIAEEGKYRITAYWEHEGSKSKIKSGVLDGITDYLLSPPTPEQFHEGYEKEFEAGSEHTLVITANSTNLVVLVEKVEVGGLQSGTYAGSYQSRSFVMELTFQIDGDAGTVVVIQERKLSSGVTLDKKESEATALTDNGDGSYSCMVRLDSFSNITFTPSADGQSLNVDFDSNKFTATLQQ